MQPSILFNDSKEARDMISRLCCCLLFLLIVNSSTLTGQLHAQAKLVGHWPLTGDATDASGNNHNGTLHNVDFNGSSALFDGRGSWIDLGNGKNLIDSTDDFAISVRLHTEEALTDVIGDILSWYDPDTRTGINFSIMNYAGVTNAQSNWRNVHFGIDADIKTEWKDCGRPGNNMYVRSLTVFDGELYASTWEPEAGDRGHIYRYAGGTEWVDCGSPDPSNCISTMGVFNGRLYAGSELYSGGGSSLPLSPNEEHGGVVYRYEGGTKWTSMGKVADVRAISGFAVYDGKLYAGTGSTGAWRDTPRHRGMYRFDGPNDWVSCGCPGLRVVHLGVHNDQLLGLSYDDGGFFRYKGEEDWLRLGPIPETTQAYSMAVYESQVHVGTWPTGSVYRLDGPQKWHNTGRLGEEKEVMGMLVYNGKLYAGTLPLAAVYRYDTDGWRNTGQLDNTPDVRYRRAWSMAVYDGKLYCGVLPSGHVHSMEAGKSVTHDKALPSGWQHLIVSRTGNSDGSGTLRLLVNGKEVASQKFKDNSKYQLSNDKPFKVGAGQHDFFNGSIRDLRIYQGKLTLRQLRELTK